MKIQILISLSSQQKTGFGLPELSCIASKKLLFFLKSRIGFA
jgi:hypothetical protein